MPSERPHAALEPATEIQTDRYLPAWQIGDLPEPPRPGWKLWVGLIGPGIVLAGTSIGSGEWLFGPAVTAQYGAALLWLALISILLQGFCNLTMMRYTVYSGEPIIVGGLRIWPGPRFWMTCWAVFDLASVWPYNASNAAVPVAAIILGRLPQSDDDRMIVKALGFAIFLLAFVPLVFGGTVYRMLEKIMTAKLVLVLGYLSLIAVTFVSWPVIHDVCTGFFRVGTVPLRAETIILERDFTVREDRGRSGVHRPRNLGKRRQANRRLFCHERYPSHALRPAKQRQADAGTSNDPRSTTRRAAASSRRHGGSSSRRERATRHFRPKARSSTITYGTHRDCRSSIRAERAVIQTLPASRPRSRIAFATCSSTKASSTSDC